MKKLAILLTVALAVTAGGCSHLQDIWDNIDWSTPVPGETPEPVPSPTTQTSPAVAKTPVPALAWRDGYDVEAYSAGGNSFEFWTRDIKTPSKTNQDGGYEYILVRIQGAGLKRLLLMSMFDRKPRIFIERTNNTYSIIDGRFSQPLPGPSKWRIAADGKRIWIELDGREIWSESGGYSVETAVMAGYARRGFLGEWRR